MAVARISETEQQLRMRIRKAFSADNAKHTELTMEIIEDRVLGLMKEYFFAPKAKRSKVYRRGEKRILEAARRRD